MKATSAQALSASLGNVYLDVRCEYVLAKLKMIGNPDGIDEGGDAVMDAVWLGYRDAQACGGSDADSDIPAFFADVPELSRAWLSGWRNRLEMEEIEHCPGCNNEHGHPCPFHDRIEH
ncbi:hypothetical protein [Burkholderia glumae]|uniref:hypothetical protein n=1 Tax=Burkholderia glumae TaxID=337 RepID=UPI001F1A4ACC|nr:hypothetical protein [Burkholderia glumae]QKM51719.1 hypothetical protein B7760_05797 [Burkholderia glumae]